MQEWWTSLMIFDKVVWIIAIVTGLIFLVQTILTFVGMDADGGMDVDFDGDFGGDHGDHEPFQLFTFRNFINFFLGFSWTVIALRKVIPNEMLLILLSAVVGVLLVAAVMYLFYAMTKMQQSGNMDIQQAVGKTAEIYLTVPGFKKGMGKVHVQVQGTLRELDAVTEGETLVSGTLVKVLDVVEDRILLVSLA